ncbi:MAG: carbohydrate ABC transporter substrate-binding protein [Lachnospiraceae bacterium]|nr:carbohydrate ABC transporter substrate-binding protein [Lachnospiraceae bacterium]
MLSGCGQQASTASAQAPAADEATAEEAPAVEETAETADTADTKEDVTITFMASQDWIQDAEMELGEKFTEETGIKVDYQIVPSDQYESLLMTKINSGECTDIFGGQSSKFSIVTQFDVEKNAVDLSGESWAGNVEPAAAEELSAGGKLYGQPIQDVSACWAVAYNIKMFDELGLSIPTNYKEFCDVCEKIKAAGIIPIYECVSDGWHHVCWTEAAVAATKADSGYPDALNENKATFEGNKELTTMFSQLKEMADKGYMGDNYMSNQYADAPASIASGEYAMVLYNQGLGAEVNAVDPSFDVDNIGYFVNPLCDNQALNVNYCGPSRFIFSGSKNIDAAKKYLEFMASDESLAYMTENVGKFNQLPYTNAPSAYSKVVQDFYDRYPEKIAVFQASVKYYNPAWMDIGADMSAMFLGEMTPEEVLKDIDKLRAEQAAAASDPAWK